jgi:hypothetical protein
MNHTRKDAEDTSLIHQPNAGQHQGPAPASPTAATSNTPADTISIAEAEVAVVTFQPVQNGEIDYPEGGLKAWSVVIGSFCAMFSIFGIINTTAVFQEYLSTHQLKNYSPGEIGWIFSVSLFLTFFGGAFVGPVFDALGPRALVLAGSICLLLSAFLLGVCTGKLYKITIVHSLLTKF